MQNTFWKFACKSTLYTEQEPYVNDAKWNENDAVILKDGTTKVIKNNVSTLCNSGDTK